MAEQDDWRTIDSAPVGKTILLGHDQAQWVAVGWGRWQGEIPRPLWDCVDDMGFGKCNPTHWRPLPAPPTQKETK